jgi:hypothetical protein
MRRLPNPADAVLIFGLLLLGGFFVESVLMPVKWIRMYPYIPVGAILIIIPVIYCLVCRYSLRHSLRLGMPDFRQMCLVVIIALSSLWVMASFVFAQDYFFKSIGVDISEEVKVLEKEVERTLSADMIFGLFIMTVLPGICEEIFFRGFVQTAFGRFGARSVLYTACLFCIIHVLIPRVTMTFLLGLIFGFVVYFTGSIFSGIICHFINNLAACLYFFYFERVGIEVKIPLPLFVLSVILFVGSFCILYLEWRKTKKAGLQNQL